MSEKRPCLRDLPQKSRRSHTADFLAASESAGYSISALKTALMLLDAPANLRFLGAICARLQSLIAKFPTLTNMLSDERSEALESLDVVLDAIESIADDDMRYELMASPSDYPKGNLYYSSEYNPLYSLLMLRLTHPEHSDHFDCLISTTAYAWLDQLPDLDWESYLTRISRDEETSDPSTISASHLRRFYSVEFELRQLSKLSENDPLSFLSKDVSAQSVDDILKGMKASRYHATYNPYVPSVARRISSLLSDSLADVGQNGRSGGNTGLVDGHALGVLISGPFHFSGIDEDEDEGDCTLHSLPNAILRRAAEEDIDPLELVDDGAIIIVNLGPANSLPRTPRNYAATKSFQQIARKQQLSPYRLDGLKSSRIDGINALLKAARNHPLPEVCLLLLASLATGRRINKLSLIDVTVDTPADGRVAPIELDLASRTWRISVNQPTLKNRPCPDGAIPVTQTVVLPDRLGACEIARRCPCVMAAQESGKMRTPISATPERISSATELLASVTVGDPVTPGYLATVMPMATFEHSGDLAIGAMISTWLPCNSSTYLHYLTVDRQVIATHYTAALQYLADRYGLAIQPDNYRIPAGHVGTTNCPSDDSTRQVATTLKEQLLNLPTKTHEQRLRYANLYTCYSTLYLCAGLGFRARRDPRPNIEPLAGLANSGFATFFDKATSPSHYRTLYCPPELRRHLEYYDSFRLALPYLIEPTGNPDRFHRNLDSRLFVIFDANGYPQELRPSHIERLIEPIFPFKLNCFRRRIRSRMVEYSGPDAQQIGRGFAIWMGHWPQFNSPHRAESGFSIHMLRRISEAIIEPMLINDGWAALEHRL